MIDVTAADVREAAARIAGHIVRTPVLRAPHLDRWVGCEVVAKAEHLQRGGAFKARGATNAVLQLDGSEARRGVAAHSSGNHAAALAIAGAAAGIPVTVVMPSDAPAVKKRAVAGHGATIVECEPTVESRERTLADVLARTGAVEVHPYDNPRVIAGAGTAALELIEEVPGIEVIMTPVGGGGLISGTSLAAHGENPAMVVIGAEPAGADDAARSLAGGALVTDAVPHTIADGLRTTLSPRTFAIISDHVADIVTVSETEIVEALRLCWDDLGWPVEPSAAVVVAGLRHAPVAGRRVGIVLTGGNVDPAARSW